MEKLGSCLRELKNKAPLVHAITNYVTINDCANILLAVGASPAMCEAADEAFEFSQLANALYLNIGTFTKEQELAMYLAIRGATLKGIPVVLDPVGCAAIPGRVDFIKKLRYFGRYTVIKGNLGEIKALAGVETKARGVDSLDEGEDGLEVCQKLAQDFGCVIVATGKTDIVTDGVRSCLVDNGTPMLTKITGAGCMAGALVAGFCGANSDPFLAATAAMVTMGLAGELAQTELGADRLSTDRPGANLSGTFHVRLIDQISLIDETLLKERGRVTWL